MPKFIHTGDLHFGAGRRLPNYLKRQTSALNAVFKIAMKRKIRIVVIAGDLFDSKDVRPEERDALLRLLLHYDDLGFIILIANGNHDQASATYTNLRFLHTLYKADRFKNVHIAISESGPEVVKVEGQNFILFPGFYDGDVNAALNGLCQDVKKPVVVMHEMVKGCKADNGFPLEHGIKLDRDLPVTYFALGDLHECQQIPKMPHAWYCGSPVQHDFGEKPTKGLLIVDTDNPSKPEFVPIDIRPRLLKADLKEALRMKDDLVIAKLERAPDDELPPHIIDFEFIRPEITAEDDVEDLKGKTADAVSSPLDNLGSFLKKSAKVSKTARKRALKMAERYYNRVLP